MKKQQSTENNYRTFNRNVQLLISEEFAEREIPANDSVRLLEKIVEEMDLRSLFGAYKRRGRKVANNPATMLKVLLYANMEGIYSSRDIERACKRDINFIWLLNGAQAPNYKRISEFRSERLSCCSEESNYESIITYYDCEDCTGCPYKKKCTKAKGNRKMQVSKKFIEQRKESLERITSEKGIMLRMNRSIQSEGAFGTVKQNYGFRQFLLRGNKKVKTEILLLAMAYNINKYHSKIQQNRIGYAGTS